MIVTDLAFLRLEETGKPRFRQLYEGIRRGILSGQLPRGSRLPATRSLAGQLGVSRTTVTAAYEQLVAEGYLEGKVGAGTFVTRDLPEDAQLVRFFEADVDVSKTSTEKPRAKKTRASAAPVRTASVDYAGAFAPGVPALDEFPLRIWSQLHRHRLRQAAPADLSYGSPAGHPLLRESLATYLRTHRAVRCDVAQVMIVSGTQQAIDLVLRLLVRPGDPVLFEDPGYPRARQACLQARARLVPLAVDEQGARPPALRGKGARTARLAYLTPSHQYPLGVTLSIDRRMQLLEWSRRTKGWIIEDDYDSEYRFGQRPIPSLQGLDTPGRTFYVGSFSKVMFPSLAIGYVVVPADLVDAFTQLLSVVSRPPSTLDQLALHDFMEEGHFGRHLRRMRKVHHLRRQVFVEGVRTRLDGKLQVLGDDAGLHCAGRLLGRKSDRRVARELLAQGVVAPALSDFYLRSDEPPGWRDTRRINGLVLGFGGVSPPKIRTAVRRMAEVLG